MPNPGAGENRQHFVSRCIRGTMDDGTTDDPKRAAAICYSKWREHMKKELRAMFKNNNPLDWYYALINAGIISE